MRRTLAIGALIAAVGGLIAWWLSFDAHSPGSQAPGAGNSARREVLPDSGAVTASRAVPATRVESPPEMRGKSLEQSARLAAPENQLAANAQPSADAGASSEPRPGATAGPKPEDQTRYPTQWRCIGMFPEGRRDYESFADSSTAWSGTFSARIASRVAHPETPGSGCYQIIAADEFKGRRVEFSLYMRTLNAAPGAHITFRSVGYGLEVDVNDTESSSVRGTSGWARHSIVIDVPLRTSLIGLGAMLENTGTLWIDEASLQIVPQNTPLTQTPKPPGHNSWNPDPSKFPTALQNGGFEDTIEAPPAP
jgi:hypothetical protein